MAQHVGGDLDQERLQITGVPGREDLRDLCRRLAGPLPDQVVRLRDQLHVGVLDAVVHHLHEVPGTVGTHIRTARRAVDLSRDVLQQRPQRLIRLRRTTGHDRRSVQRSFLTTRHPRPDEVQPLRLQILLPPDRVREVRVAGIDDDVAGLQQRDQLLDHRIRPRARLDHDQHPPRTLQRRHEVRHRLARHETPPCSTASCHDHQPTTASSHTSDCGSPPDAHAGRSSAPDSDPSPPSR